MRRTYTTGNLGRSEPRPINLIHGFRVLNAWELREKESGLLVDTYDTEGEAHRAARRKMADQVAVWHYCMDYEVRNSVTGKVRRVYE
jgi:hypothetical protein